MTAFAREQAHTPQGELIVELRSVNHRYFDCSFRIPDALRALEPRLREKLSATLARGKVECLMRLQAHAGESSSLAVDEARLDDLLGAARLVAERLGEAAPVSPMEILQFPGIYTSLEQSEEALQDTAVALFAHALENLQASRRREGDNLAALIDERLVAVEELVRIARTLLPELMQAQRDRITARITELGTEVDEGRLEQELVYMAQKTDVDEELDRLSSHAAEVRRALGKGGPCGRRLDFLMQELNREANTLSSKSQSVRTTLDAVELKVLIEQMREQIQNIE
ncbi:MAG: YicC/YloC family endoribonuclease [Halioglobus sp.]|nr:YicC/YloC family endoribonuclease [Halioglobus sp.]